MNSANKSNTNENVPLSFEPSNISTNDIKGRSNLLIYFYNHLK